MKKETITELEHRYGFIVEDTPLKLGGQSNDNYALITNRGKIVIRKYNPFSSVEKRAVEHQVLTYLSAKGVDYIPKLLTCTESQQAITTIEDDTYAAFEFIEGEQYQGTTAETYDAGRKLGLIHAALEDVNIDPKLVGSKKIVGIRERWLERIKLGNVERTGALGTDVMSILEKISRRTYDEQDLKENHFHADYHPGNVLFKEGKVVAVLDFEAAFKHGHRILDLAFGGYNFGMHYNPSTGDLEDIDHERLKSFLRGYHEANPLTKTEIQTIGDALITHRAEYLVHFLEEAKGDRSEVLESKIREAVATIRLAENRRESILTLLL